MDRFAVCELLEVSVGAVVWSRFERRGMDVLVTSATGSVYFKQIYMKAVILKPAVSRRKTDISDIFLKCSFSGPSEPIWLSSGIFKNLAKSVEADRQTTLVAFDVGALD